MKLRVETQKIPSKHFSSRGDRRRDQVGVNSHAKSLPKEQPAVGAFPFWLVVGKSAPRSSKSTELQYLSPNQKKN